MPKPSLQVKIFENISQATLELDIEKFLRECPNIKIENVGYVVQKERGKETSPQGYYSCIIFYRR